MSHKCLTDVCLEYMQTVQYGQEQKEEAEASPNRDHRIGNEAPVMGPQRGLLSLNFVGRIGKIRFVLLVKCPFAGYFLSSYLEK